MWFGHLVRRVHSWVHMLCVCACERCTVISSDVKMFAFINMFIYMCKHMCVGLSVHVCAQLMPWFVSRCPYAARQGRAYGHLVEDRNTTNRL